jgi:hypothetical protein
MALRLEPSTPSSTRIRAAWLAAASEGETMQLDRELEAQMRALGYHDPRD